MAGQLERVDPEMAQIVQRELIRQRTTLQLIASENFASPAVLAATGSVLTNKYSEGYPAKRYYGGNEVIDESESLTIDRAKALFGCDHANVQSHSGASANMAAYLALVEPGDKIMGMRLDQGGHLTHGSPVNASGILYDFVAYGLDENERLDYDQVRDVAITQRPKLIVAGATAYPRQIDFAAFRQVADEVDAVLMVDAAHIMGLIAGGAHPSPIPYADVVTSTTHKTLRGPRGAIICCKEPFAARIDKAVFPGSQGGPFDHAIAAKGVCFHEAMQPEFKEYVAAVVTNAQALAGALSDLGVRCVSGGTDNHLVLADLRSLGLGVTGRDAEKLLDRAGISLNRNTVPDDPEPPFRASGIRLGTAAVTTAGMGPDEMCMIAELIVRVLKGGDDEVPPVREEARRLTANFSPYPEGVSLPQEA